MKALTVITAPPSAKFTLRYCCFLTSTAILIGNTIFPKGNDAAMLEVFIYAASLTPIAPVGVPDTALAVPVAFHQKGEPHKAAGVQPVALRTVARVD